MVNNFLIRIEKGHRKLEHYKFTLFTSFAVLGLQHRSIGSKCIQNQSILLGFPLEVPTATVNGNMPATVNGNIGLHLIR